MKKLTISDLNKLHTDSNGLDNEVYAEMRSNVLLVSGEHYARRTRKYFDRLRENESIPSDQRIRIVANHIQKITKLYCNNTLAYVPGVQAYPNNDTETQDVKCADLSNKVWDYGKRQFGWEVYRRNSVFDFFTLGEVGSKVYFDQNKGKFLGKKPKPGYEPQLDEQGQPLPPDEEDLVPTFSGELCVERLYGFNLFRAKEAKTWAESWFIGNKKLAQKKQLEARYAGDEDKLKYIQTSFMERFVIFDGTSSSYRESENEVLVYEVFVRPCPDYPNGAYYYHTAAGIIEEGELPYGIWPIAIENCEEYQTSPRGRSPIKHGRPFQAELNRAISKMAEHQITLGDDKMVFSHGSKVSQGAAMPGVRAIYTTGGAPAILEGRSGEQYLGYTDFIIKQLYSAMMVEEDMAETDKSQADPYAMLYASVSQKKKFSFFTQKIEGFFANLMSIYLDLARHYMSDEDLLAAIGRDEVINVSEFRNMSPLAYMIKACAVSEDAETALGKQLVYNHVLQYVGPNLSRDDIGKILRSMPYGDFKNAFSDFTMDDENANNDILRIERGDVPSIRPGMDPEYILKRITARQKKPDYEFLPPAIKEVYETYSAALAEQMADEVVQQKALQADFIPAQGFLTPCDFYVPDPATPSKTHRARLPIDSLAWLVKRLEGQGITLEKLESLQGSAQSQVASAAGALAGVDAQEAIANTVGQPNPGDMNARNPIVRQSSNVRDATRGNPVTGVPPTPNAPVPQRPGGLRF